MKNFFQKYVKSGMENFPGDSNALLFCLFGFLIFCVPAFAANAPASIERYVFAISANDGGKDRATLRYAESDAKAFASVLKELGGVPQKNVLLVHEPSLSQLNARFDQLDKMIRQTKGNSGRDEVLVYYSGHADEKGLRLGSELYVWSEFRKRVDALSSDVKIAVIDACGSGAIIRAKGGVSVPAFMMDKSSDMKGYAFITSSTQDESSQESDKLQGSFFTHSLVSGLRGAGDASGDGKVTLSEAYQFAFNETLLKTETTMGGAQHPSRDMNLMGTGDVVMTDLRSTSAGLELNEDVDGRIFVRDENGVLVAELYKKSGRAMSLGLPAGKYTVRLERPAEYKETAVALVDGKREHVGAKRFQKVAAEETVSRGNLDKNCAAGDTVKCSLDSLDHHGVSRVSFNVVDIENKPRKGTQLGFFVTVTKDYMLGSQVSLLANIADKEMHGVQMSALSNIADEHLEGAQISSVFNYANSFDGLQLSTVNVSRNSSQGAQIGTINVATDSVKSLQLSVVNAAAYAKVQVGAVNGVGTSGTQVGVVNGAGKADLQLSTLNAAGTSGTQVGIVNVTGKSTGRQWGVINVCGNCENTPIGLISFVGNGVWSASGIFNEMGGTGVKVDLGTAYFYTSFESARNFKDDKLFERYDRIFETGFGVGTHFGRYGSHFELEYMFLNVTSKYAYSFGFVSKNEKTAFHHRVRFGATYQLFTGVGLSGGVSLNLATRGYADKNPLKPLGDYHADFGSETRDGRFWPGFYAGLTLGRF